MTASLFASETKHLIITLVDSSGNPVDLNGASFKWKLNVRNNPIVKTSPSEDISIIDANNGKLDIVLNSIDTINIPSGNYLQDLQVTDSNGNVSIIQLDMLQILSSPF